MTTSLAGAIPQKWLSETVSIDLLGTTVTGTLAGISPVHHDVTLTLIAGTEVARITVRADHPISHP